MAKILIREGVNAQGVPFKEWKITRGNGEEEEVPKEDRDSEEELEKGKKRKRDVGED